MDTFVSQKEAMAPWASCIWMGQSDQEFQVDIHASTGSCPWSAGDSDPSSTRVGGVDDSTVFQVGRVCGSVISSFCQMWLRVKMHAVADRTVDVLPLHEWKTECGWTVGLADFPSVQVR